MRLSDIRGDRVFEVLADLVEPLCSIASDPEASALFRGGDRPEGMDRREYVLQRLRQSVPALMRNHSDDLCAVLAALEGVPVAEFRESATMASVIGGLYEMVTDEDLLAFLSSAGDTEAPSGSA